MATRYNIVVPKKYEKDGEEKTAWQNVGKLVRFPASGEKSEGYIMELNMFPNVTFKIFEEKPREERPAAKSAAETAWDEAVDTPVAKDDIDPLDIPF